MSDHVYEREILVYVIDIFFGNKFYIFEYLKWYSGMCVEEYLVVSDF